jgi:hypothetical protein
MFSTWVGVVLLFAVFGMLAFVALKASPRGDNYEEKRAKTRAEKYDAAQKEYFTALTTYGWVDKAKGVARIPVNDAMRLTLAELANKKPTAAGPIVVAQATQSSPAPSAATSPGTSPSPAASASPSPSPSATPASDLSATPKPSSVSGHDSAAHAQPAAAVNPPAAPPGTQPGASSTPAASAPPAPAKAPVSPSPSPAASAPGTPLPVRGKTP